VDHQSAYSGIVVGKFAADRVKQMQFHIKLFILWGVTEFVTNNLKSIIQFHHMTPLKITKHH